MRLNPAAFNRFLGHIGQRVLWRRSFACACVSPTSGAPDHKHALCHGKGILWDDPISCVVGMASQKVTAEWMKSGMYQTGDAVLSVPSDSALYRAGQFDRIVLLNSTDVFSMPRTRGGNDERMLFPVASVDRVFWLHPTTRAIVEGGVPIVDADGVPSWPNGGAPPDGMTYSITGTKFSEYFVFQSLISDRGEHQGARLPKKLVARQWDLMGR